MRSPGTSAISRRSNSAAGSVSSTTGARRLRSPRPCARSGQCGCPAHAVCGMCVDQGKLAAAEQAAVDLDMRFQASTNVVMDLERPEDETAELLPRCVHVSDETKRRLLGEWSNERMAHALPVHACASCGVRDPSLSYSRVDLSALPRTVCVRVAAAAKTRRGPCLSSRVASEVTREI